MEWGVAINVHEDYHQTVEIAKLIEDAEMTYIWIVDFPAPRFAPVMAVKIASITSSSRIGIGLLPALVYNPEYVVRFTETLISEFGERFDLLIGPGDRESLHSIGKKNWIPRKVVRKTVETAVSIKQGLKEVGVRCPVWLAAQGPKMISESRKLDGVLLNLTDPEMVKWALSYLKEHSSSFKVGLFSPTKVTKSVIPPTSDFLNSAAIVALGASKTLLQLLGNEAKFDSARTLYATEKKLSTKVLEELGIENLVRWGFFSTPEILVKSLNHLKDIGVETVIFGPPISHSRSSIGLLLETFKKYSTSGH